MNILFYMIIAFSIIMAVVYIDDIRKGHIFRWGEVFIGSFWVVQLGFLIVKTGGYVDWSWWLIPLPFIAVLAFSMLPIARFMQMRIA